MGAKRSGFRIIRLSEEQIATISRQVLETGIFEIRISIDTVGQVLMGNKKCRFTCAKGSVLSVPFRATRQYFSEGGENVRHVPFISVPWDSTFLTESNLPLGRQSFCLTMPYGNLTWTMHLRYNNLYYQ